MKSIEIICCLSIVIFALAVAHPLPDNVLEQVEEKPEPSKAAPPVNDPSEAALLLHDPTKAALLLSEPTTPAYLRKLSAEDTVTAVEMSQDDLQELQQQDPEALMFLKDTLEAVFNDTPEEREFQQDE